MKKLISISVWGKNSRYIIGARRQIELAKKYLPDWNIRIYVDEPTLANFFREVEVITQPNELGGMFWRFYPLFDSSFDIVASRDSDSRFSFRECRAMQEFVDSGKRFHVIRDHESHFEFPIMAGLFACRGTLDLKYHMIMREYMKHNHNYLCDQIFLRDYIWPVVSKDTLVHSMNEGWFGETRKTLKNRFSFVGNGYDENDMPLYAPTLKECVGFDPKQVDASFEFDGGFYE